jgi:Cellulase (glycosyl hydrolase family 5)
VPRVPRSARLSGSVAVLLSAVALCAGPGSPAQASNAKTSTVPYGFVGVNLDDPVWPDTAKGINLGNQFTTMRSDGVQSVRVVFDWATAQPYQSWSQVPAAQRARFTNINGVPTDFAQMDQIVALATAHGMSVLPTVIYAPAWDTTGATSTTLGRPKKTAPYSAFLTALVKRYGPSGSYWHNHKGKRPIRAWEIWNEPDLRAFWPQPFANTYVTLLKAAHAAIHKADPGAEVVLGGLTNYSWKDLAKIYAVKGARSAFDALALHPYTTYPKGVVEIMQLVRSVMAKNGDASKPLLIDEFGWASAATSSSSESMVATTPTEQAQKVGQVLQLLAQHRVSLKIQSFDYYTWMGNESTAAKAGTNGAPGSLVESIFQYSGLQKYVNGTITAKPVLKVFAQAALAMEGRSGS